MTFKFIVIQNPSCSALPIYNDWWVLASFLGSREHGKSCEDIYDLLSLTMQNENDWRVLFQKTESTLKVVLFYVIFVHKAITEVFWLIALIRGW